MLVASLRLRVSLLVCSFAVTFSLASLSVAQDGPVPPSLAAAQMTAPPGFDVTLFAGEPDVTQPIAMTFDTRGRLWVVECLAYPKWSTDGTGKDRVVILEDTDGDGKHDKRTVFLEDGVNLSGIELGHGGVWLTATPNLLFVPDRNADDVPDGKPEVVLDGWDVKAQHNIFNSLVWGPDGWLYGCNGILSRSRVGRPGTPDDQRTAIDCGVWRYSPQTGEFNVVASGSTNPFGLDFDEYGQAFITNCVIKHLFHVIPGAHYERMFGQDPNPYAYELLPSCADHIHWGGGHWTTARGGQAHDDAGGGHAHSGCAIYLADQFPAEYRNSVFMSNIHGSRLNRDILQRDGAGYIGQHAADFVHANDPWFRGICVKCAPDGSLFVSDWSDTGECHNYEVVDASNGRIFRISYGETPAPAGDLSQSSLAELVDLQFSRNDWLSRQARRLLQERTLAAAAAGTDTNIDTNTDTDATAAAAANNTSQEALELLQKLQPSDEREAVRQVWALYAVGGMAAIQASGLTDTAAPEWVRFWAIQLAADETSAWTTVLRQSIARQLDDTTPLIERSLASTCQRRIRLGFAEDVQDILARLLRLPTDAAQSAQAAHSLSLSEAPADDRSAEVHAAGGTATDAHLLAALKWYAVEPLVATHTDWVLDQLASIQPALIQRLIARRLMALEGGLARLTQAWHSDAQGAWIAASLDGVLQATVGMHSLPRPEGWNAIYQSLQKHADAQVRELSRQLSTLFGDTEALAAYSNLLMDSQAAPQERLAALQLLQNRQSTELGKQLSKLLDSDARQAQLDTNLRKTVIRTLAAIGGSDVAQRLLAIYPGLTVEEQQEVVYALTMRLPLAHALLDAIETGSLPRADVSSLVIKQLQALGDASLNERLEAVWGKVRPVSETKRQQIDQYRTELSADGLSSADKAAGQVVYQKTCGACHKLFGQGGSIGPELTGGQRHNLDYLLDNIIDPNAIVPGDYRMVMLMLDDGQILSGIVAAENPVSIQLQTATDLVTVTHDRVEQRRMSELSIMPEGILDNLTATERRDLVAYLQASGPVPAAGAASAEDAASEDAAAEDAASENTQPADPDDVGRWHLLSPPWKSEIVYGESVTLLQESAHAPLMGRLAFGVQSIEAIVSSNSEVELTDSPELQIDRESGKFTLPGDSLAPRISVDRLFPPVDSPGSYRHRVGHPDQALLYGPNRWFHDHQIEVTYKRRGADWHGPLPKFAGELLPRTLRRLREQQPLTIGCSGDSIAAGGDASSLSRAAPLQPAFPQLVEQQLRSSFEIPVTLKNRAVGGWSIQNGLDDLDALLAEKPQLIIVAYGMNDVGRRDPQWFHDRMQEFLQRVHQADATIEIIMVTPMLGHAEWIHTPREMFNAYRDQIAGFVGPGVALADVGAIWEELLRRKHDLDLTGNGLNHPNDFGHRLYAQTILALLVE